MEGRTIDGVTNRPEPPKPASLIGLTSKLDALAIVESSAEETEAPTELREIVDHDPETGEITGEVMSEDAEPLETGP